MKIQETSRSMDRDLKKLILGTFLSVVLGLLLRTPSDIKDGLSLRGDGVGYWSWHVFGLAGRDFLQAILTFYISIKALLSTYVIGKKAMTYIAINFAICALLSFWWHNFVYNWTLENLKYFGW